VSRAARARWPWLAAALLLPLAATAQEPEEAATAAELLELSSQEQSILDELEVIEVRLMVIHTEM